MPLHYSDAAVKNYSYIISQTVVHAALATILHILGSSYTLLASIWITTYPSGPLDALLTYLTCDCPPHEQYAELQRHEPAMLGFYGTAVMLHEYCAPERLKLFSAYVYMLAFTAWSLRSLWNQELFLAFAGRVWQYPMVQAASNGVSLACCLAWHYGTLIDDWAWEHRSKTLSRCSYQTHQIWIPILALQWQQVKARHTRPRHAYEYHGLMNREIKFLKLQRRLPFAEVTSKLIHVSLDDFDIPPFEAISYYRSDSGETSRTIAVDSRTLQVTNTAYEVLLDRSSLWRTRGLWLDFVCIN